MLRRSQPLGGKHMQNLVATNPINFYSPPVIIPDHHWMRVANQKEVHLTDKKDPKNYHGRRNKDFFAKVNPSLWGLDRHNFANWDNKGGIIMDVPPVPVYRKYIWCIGHSQHRNFHPRIHIKVPRGKIVCCKWCRCKFLNMATDEDNDDNWEKDFEEIQTTPESKKDLMRPFRRMDGSWPKDDNNFAEGVEPDRHIYRTVFDPMKNYYNKYNITPPEHVAKRIEAEKDVPILDAWKRHWKKKKEKMALAKTPEEAQKIAIGYDHNGHVPKDYVEKLEGLLDGAEAPPPRKISFHGGGDH